MRFFHFIFFHFLNYLQVKESHEPNELKNFNKKQIFNYLEKESVEVSGNIIGIQGNLKAIEKKERYIDVDLNRIWKQKNINLLKKGKLTDKHEYKELKNILCNYK